MKILLLHNYYQQAGGEDAVVCSEKELLESRGHSVRLLEANNDGIKGVVGKVRAALGYMYSYASWQRVSAELGQFRPDIVHVHNLFPVLSPSVLYVCSKAGVPVVQTLHNYRRLCAGSFLFRDGSICEKCIGKRIAIPAMAYGCYRGSKAGSLAIVASTAVHNALGTYEHKVRRYIALTEFAKNKFVEGGISAAQLDVKPNFLERDPGVGDGRGNYILYVGRLSSEKGLDVLLRAWKGLGALVPLKIAGEGPLADHCKRASSENPAIEYLGHKSLPEVLTLMGNALALVFPSLWYEGFPRTIVESLAKGTPVIASNLGSMQELIAHRRTGLHFDPYAEGSLEEQVEWMLAHVQEIRCMRLAARAEYELKYSAEKNHTMLMDIYQRAISQ